MDIYNPLRYRGYVYDTETGLYYLQSRYYDPELGRFINADGIVSTRQGFIGNNMFAYCLNNPTNGCDPCGTCFHRWDFWNDCEKCGGETIQDKWNNVVEWVEDTYDTINDFHQQQAQIEAEITAQQNELFADAAGALWDAYMRGYDLQQEAQLLEAQMTANVAPRIIGAGLASGMEAALATAVGNGVNKSDQQGNSNPAMPIIGSFVGGFVVGVVKETWQILKEIMSTNDLQGGEYVVKDENANKTNLYSAYRNCFYSRRPNIKYHQSAFTVCMHWSINRHTS